MIPKRKKLQSIDATGLIESVVAVIGSVDSGKSSTVGTLVYNILDDGKGLSRSSVFVHPHERESGRTSDISLQYTVLEEYKKIVTFVDLAGHEAYLHTTITGFSSTFPDFAIVCISDKITKMTNEHIKLCLVYEIPFVILLTKCDMIPIDKTKEIIDKLKKLFGTKKKMYHCKQIKDVDTTVHSTLIPYILTSNKTGIGLDLLKHTLGIFKNREKLLPYGFIVEHIYNITGHGTVLSGFSGIDIKIGDKLFIGPLYDESFTEITVKSIHNDYRFSINMLPKGTRGCLAISNIKNKQKKSEWIRKGMLVSPVNNPPNICKRFITKVRIMHHSATISVGFNALINCGALKDDVKFIEIKTEDGIVITNARSNDIIYITMEFGKHSNYVQPNQKLTFRDGSIKGFGMVVNT